MKSSFSNIVLAALILPSAFFLSCSAYDIARCLGSDLFVFASGQSVSFSEAEANCKSREGSLARIQSLEEFSFVTNLVDGAQAWVGVHAEAAVRNPSPGKADFVFNDGNSEEEPFVQVLVGSFPWADGQPVNFMGNEPCAQIENGHLNDPPCETNLPFVCRIGNFSRCRPSISRRSTQDDIPTRSPTRVPTETPTRSPTNFPSRAPTRSPTITPSISPTRAPTNTPTISPTPSPSRAPTRSPTTTPTFFPTASPSVTPPFPVRECVARKLGIRNSFA